MKSQQQKWWDAPTLVWTPAFKTSLDHQFFICSPSTITISCQLRVIKAPKKKWGFSVSPRLVLKGIPKLKCQLILLIFQTLGTNRSYPKSSFPASSIRDLNWSPKWKSPATLEIRPLPNLPSSVEKNKISGDPRRITQPIHPDSSSWGFSKKPCCIIGSTLGSPKTHNVGNASTWRGWSGLVSRVEWIGIVGSWWV